MSVTVRHLNGDSTFLLIFSPEPNPHPSDLRSVNGAYSILIDPWLVGSSVTTAPWFAITNRVEPSSIQHLSELEDEPNVVICSQNKTDHTNKETLLQLRPAAATLIIAEPGAAKTIKSWDHFDPSRIHTMDKYDAKSRIDNVLRLPIPPLSPQGDAGLVTITFVPAKNYVTGLHNAFGITYQPPTTAKGLTSVSTIDLATAKALYQPRSKPTSPHLPIYTLPNDSNLSGSTAANTDKHSVNSSIANLPAFDTIPSQRFPSVITPPEDYDSVNEKSGFTEDFSFFSFGDHVEPEPFSFASNMPTPPASPRIAAFTRSSSFSTMSSSKASATNPSSKLEHCNHSSSRHDKMVVQSNRSKTISIIYSPHGLPLSDLQPYVRRHLVGLPGALPLTLLLHSFDHTANPWYLGGNITTGAEGGMQIAKALMARCWISAHDAEKEKGGIAVKMLRLKKTELDEVKQQFQTSHNAKSPKWNCDIRCMGIGEEVILSNSTKQLVGFEVNDSNVNAELPRSLTYSPIAVS